ncbi:MAG: hypothetical protein DRI75_02115 [Bacteroidetes bacterium]|nr:MAG: hypothetical protein DRI75_02115 [Bacteroidota bacterium]
MQNIKIKSLKFLKPWKKFRFYFWFSKGKIPYFNMIFWFVLYQDKMNKKKIKKNKLNLMRFLPSQEIL